MIIAGRGYKDYSYSGAFGFTSSLPVLVAFTPSTALETGFSYYMKSYGYSRIVNEDSTVTKTLDYKIFNHFLSLPFAFRYTYAVPESALSFFASLGGYVGLWVYGSRSGYVYSVSTNPSLVPFAEKANLGSYNIFQAGISASTGLGFKFSGRRDGYIKIGYSLTLTDLNKAQKYGSYPIHNSTFFLTGGVLWRVN